MKGTRKTTTYSLDWDIIVNLESRMLRDFKTEKSKSKGTELLIISIGSRLGLRVIDNLSLKWKDLIDISVGERFIRIEKKTDRERILIMSSKLKEVIDVVYNVLRPNLDEYIFTSQKGRGKNPMTTQTFNRKLKSILSTYRVRYIGNCSSHLLRKSWVVGTIKKGFENGDHLSLVKVSRLIGHSNVTTTLRYTNFEVSQSFGLFELD
jgi:integrase